MGLAGIANLSVAMPFDPKFGSLGRRATMWKCPAK
jgi:hypothetical protein